MSVFHFLSRAFLLPQTPYVQAPRLESEPEAVASGIKDKDIAARLAAAARRRRERLAQQQQQQVQPGTGQQQAAEHGSSAAQRQDGSSVS